VRNRIRAFTLVELLVVIAIVFILGAMLIPALMRARLKSRIAKVSKCLNISAGDWTKRELAKASRFGIDNIREWWDREYYPLICENGDNAFALIAKKSAEEGPPLDEIVSDPENSDSTRVTIRVPLGLS